MTASTQVDTRQGTLHRRLGEPTKVLGNARGELLIWAMPERGLIVTIGRGHGAAEFAEPFLVAANAAIAQGAREIWDDWAEIGSYDPATRVRITDWTRARPEIAKNIHVLVGSKLIAMGVSLANLALGNLFEVTSDRARFERSVLAKL